MICAWAVRSSTADVSILDGHPSGVGVEFRENRVSGQGTVVGNDEVPTRTKYCRVNYFGRRWRLRQRSFRLRCWTCTHTLELLNSGPYVGNDALS